MRRFVILFLSLLASVNAWAWGAKGHDVTAYIAECNLTPEAAERIDRVLGGYSIVYFANWLDTASHTPEYAYSKTWHYANIDEGYTFETMPRNPHGDVVSAVEMLVEELRGGRLDPEKEALYLKMLVHLMGDLHCPMHSGRLTDVGGNTLPVPFFEQERAVGMFCHRLLKQVDDGLFHSGQSIFSTARNADWGTSTLPI